MAFGTAPVLPEGHEALLHAEERKLLPYRASPKRRAEFSAGRAAARRALAGLLPWPGLAQELPILSTPGSGRPWVGRLREGPALHVSITHVDGLALAAAARVPVGIDLVSIQPEASSFASDAFTAGELADWASWLGVEAEDPFATAVAFAAKEAASKLLGVGLTIPLLSFRIVPSGRVICQRLLGLEVPVELFSASLVLAEETLPLSACLARFNQHLMVAFT